MFGWFKKRKAKDCCPKCKFKLTLSYDKDAVLEPYEYEGLSCKKLATTLCPSCKTELFIILFKPRAWEYRKYLALDPEFEMEKEKYNEENVEENVLLMEEIELRLAMEADDEQTEKKITDLDEQSEKWREKRLEWERRTKEKLGYK